MEGGLSETGVDAVLDNDDNEDETSLVPVNMSLSRPSTAFDPHEQDSISFFDRERERLVGEISTASLALPCRSQSLP